MDKSILKKQRENQTPPRGYTSYVGQQKFERLWKDGASCATCNNRTSNCWGLPDPCNLWQER